MSNAVFGKAVLRTFTADDGSEYLVLPTQTPTIYIFDYAPSYDQAIAGFNALATVSTWTPDGDGKKHSYSIPALDDPDPQSSVTEKEYWEAILYRLETGEQQQLKLRMFLITRANGLESIPDLAASDITSVWPAVSSYISDAQLDAFLPLAISFFRRQIGIEKYSLLSKLSDAKIAIAYKAIEMMAASQVVKGASDKFIWMVDYFGKLYSDALAQLVFPMDADKDGRPEQVTQTAQSVVISSR